MTHQFSYTITDPGGIHARPAGLLVRKAQEFPDEITLSKGEKTANLKKLLAVMGLGIRQGDTVTVTVEGEKQTADLLETFFREHL